MHAGDVGKAHRRLAREGKYHSPFMEPDASALSRWVELLRGTAEQVTRTAGPMLPGGAGAPFALAVAGVHAIAPDPVPRGDAGLWWAVIDEMAYLAVGGLVDLSDTGPLLPRDRYLGIEVWTESELCALHALFNLAILHQRADLMERAARARNWHMGNTQPDNATGRPWAIHGFILGGTPEAQHYAETLLHNTLAVTGQPDPTSAWILLDAAKALENRRKTEKRKR